MSAYCRNCYSGNKQTLILQHAALSYRYSIISLARAYLAFGYHYLGDIERDPCGIYLKPVC